MNYVITDVMSFRFKIRADDGEEYIVFSEKYGERSNGTLELYCSIFDKDGNNVEGRFTEFKKSDILSIFNNN